MLLKIFSSIRFLGRQGLPLQGDYSKTDESEVNSNFIQILKLRGLDDPALLKLIGQSRNDKYTFPDIQNEILQIMGLKILRDIASEIGKNQFVIMLDKATDKASIEQLVLCFRWVDSKFKAHEEFVGPYALETIQADHIVQVLEDTLLRMQLQLANCRGQTSGKRSGVATQIQRKVCERQRLLYFV